jgi:hypothetical protein
MFTSQLQTLSHKVLSSTFRLNGIQIQTLMVIGSDCISGCKSNYHTIMTAPHALEPCQAVAQSN